MAGLVTNSGLTNILTLWAADITHLGVGNGAADPAATDTALQTELDRNAVVKTITGNQLVVEAFFATSEANGTIRELGMFDAAVAGNMDFRGQPSAPQVKTSAKQLRVTLTFTLSNT